MIFSYRTQVSVKERVRVTCLTAYMWRSLLMASLFMNERYKGWDIQGYKVCKACADSTEANTYLGRMLSSGIDCVKCGWLIGRCLKKKKRIKVFHDLPRPQSPTFNASALAKNPRCKSSKTTRAFQFQFFLSLFQ